MSGKQTSKLIKKENQQICNQAFKVSSGIPLQIPGGIYGLSSGSPYSFSFLFLPFFQLINYLDIPINMLSWNLKFCCDSFFLTCQRLASLPTAGRFFFLYSLKEVLHSGETVIFPLKKNRKHY
jgi:hypothetical protein